MMKPFLLAHFARMSRRHFLLQQRLAQAQALNLHLSPWSTRQDLLNAQRPKWKLETSG